MAVDLPDSTEVLETRFVPGLTDEVGGIRDALRDPIASPPLRSLVKPGDRVVVVHTDITRATPNDRLLPVLVLLVLPNLARADIVTQPTGERVPSNPGCDSINVPGTASPKGKG